MITMPTAILTAFILILALAGCTTAQNGIPRPLSDSNITIDLISDDDDRKLLIKVGLFQLVKSMDELNEDHLTQLLASVDMAFAEHDNMQDRLMRILAGVANIAKSEALQQLLGEQVHLLFTTEPTLAELRQARTIAYWHEID